MALNDAREIADEINRRVRDYEYEGRTGWSVTLEVVEDEGIGRYGDVAATVADFTAYGPTSEDALRNLADALPFNNS